VVWWLIILAAVGLFSFVVFFGAPYVPTMKAQRRAALKLLDLQAGQTLYDLGCGDGQLLVEAAKQGIKSVGFELNPLLVLVAKARSLQHRSLIRVRWANFWRADLSAADGLFVFLIGHYMAKLDRKLSRETLKPIKLASVAFKIPGRQTAAHQRGVYLYDYQPARPAAVTE